MKGSDQAMENRKMTHKDVAKKYFRMSDSLLGYVSKNQIYSEMASKIPFTYVDSKGNKHEIKSLNDLEKVVNDVVSYIRHNREK